MTFLSLLCHLCHVSVNFIHIDQYIIYSRICKRFCIHVLIINHVRECLNVVVTWRKEAIACVVLNGKPHFYRDDRDRMYKLMTPSISRRSYIVSECTCRVPSASFFITLCSEVYATSNDRYHAMNIFFTWPWFTVWTQLILVYPVHFMWLKSIFLEGIFRF